MVSKIGSFSVLFLLFVVGCYEEATIKLNDVIIDMGAKPTSIVADGVSRTLISVTLPDETVDAANSVVLTATKGVFESVGKNTITVSAQTVSGNDGKSQKIASTYLVAPVDESLGYVSAMIKNFTRTDSIQFTRAYPDSITMKVDKLVYKVDTNVEITVTTQIKRNQGRGTPSLAQVITLEAVDATGTSIGVFRNKNVVTDSSGTCVNYFSLEYGSAYAGDVTIRASVSVGDTGERQGASTLIHVIH